MTTDASIAASIDALTTQTTSLLNVCTTSQSNVTTLISGAVATSQNAAQIPLVTMATNLTTMQALLVKYIARG